jgi:DNA-binding NtrC family response regulator
VPLADADSRIDPWNEECLMLWRTSAPYRTQGSKVQPESVQIMPTPKETLETILVVEDDVFVRRMVVKILEAANFRVLSASSGPAALKIAERTTDCIDLLLSDVDMPLMSGPDLGEALKKTRPDIHVMLMSGGANGNLLVLNYGWAFVEKPFVPVKLVQMVTDVLHTQDRSQLGGKEFDSRKDRW